MFSFTCGAKNIFCLHNEMNCDTCKKYKNKIEKLHQTYEFEVKNLLYILQKKDAEILRLIQIIEQLSQ